jgi:hypothetical protein
VNTLTLIGKLAVENGDGSIRIEPMSPGFALPAVGRWLRLKPNAQAGYRPGIASARARAYCEGISSSLFNAIPSWALGDLVYTADDASEFFTFAPRDPLDVAYDGVPLRELLERDERRRRERPLAFLNVTRPTPVQRAAISAHWSAQLRAKVAATAESERNQVRADLAVIE